MIGWIIFLGVVIVLLGCCIFMLMLFLGTAHGEVKKWYETAMQWQRLHHEAELNIDELRKANENLRSAMAGEP